MESVGVNSEFWRGKRVFVTGHTGFKGSWLALWLQHLGAEVTGYALSPPTNPSLFDLARVREGMTEVHGDVRDLELMRKALRKAGPEIVIHMAAQSLVRTSYLDPIETYSVNVVGTVTLFEAVRRTGGIRVVVNVTSDKCYENREWVWGYRENEPMGGYDPYSSSKGCAELATAAYHRSFFNPSDWANHGVAIASVRAGNVIGGGDWANDRLVPDMIRAFSKDEPVLIRRPGAIRPWQHVLEPLSGYMLLAQKLLEEGPAYAEAWNFGPNDEATQSVYWLADRFVALWGEGVSWKLDSHEYPHEAHNLRLDTSKARIRLGWRPHWQLETALRATVEWYKAHKSGTDLRQLTMNQIEHYCARV